MARELDGEARMTIQTLAAHGVANTETARLLGVTDIRSLRGLARIRAPESRG